MCFRLDLYTILCKAIRGDVKKSLKAMIYKECLWLNQENCILGRHLIKSYARPVKYQVRPGIYMLSLHGVYIS